MKPKVERNQNKYVAEDGNVTILKAFRMPEETILVIEAAQEYYGVGSFTDTVFQLLDRGLKAYQNEDQRFDDLIFDTINSAPTQEPRRVIPGAKKKSKDDRVKEQEWVAYMRETYQYLDKAEYLEHGIPALVIDQFLAKLG